MKKKNSFPFLSFPFLSFPKLSILIIFFFPFILKSQDACCLQLDDCNINCNGDFESFTSEANMQQILTYGTGLFTSFTFGDPTFQLFNSPELVQGSFSTINGGCGMPINGILPIDGNQMLALRISYGTNNNVNPPRREGVAFELCETISPGDNVKVEFSAMNLTTCLPFNPQIQLEFTQNAPISGANVYVNPGVVSNTEFVPISAVNPNSETNVVNFTNNTNLDWNHLLLSVDMDPLNFIGVDDGYIFVDDVNVSIMNAPDITLEAFIPTKDVCPGDIGTMTVLICNTDGNPSPEFELDANLANGLNHIPNDNFPSTTITYPEGYFSSQDCEFFALQFQVDPDLNNAGQDLAIDLSLEPEDCSEPLTATDNVTLNTDGSCGVEDFTCPCIGGINIAQEMELCLVRRDCLLVL